MSNIELEVNIKRLSEEELIQQQAIVDRKDAVSAYYFLLNNPFADSKLLINLILESEDPRVMYETALNIPDAPIDLLYKRVKQLNNFFFKTLFETEVLD